MPALQRDVQGCLFHENKLSARASVHRMPAPTLHNSSQTLRGRALPTLYACGLARAPHHAAHGRPLATRQVRPQSRVLPACCGARAQAAAAVPGPAGAQPGCRARPGGGCAGAPCVVSAHWAAAAACAPPARVSRLCSELGCCMCYTVGLVFVSTDSNGFSNCAALGSNFTALRGSVHIMASHLSLARSSQRPHAHRQPSTPIHRTDRQPHTH
jgi:hypothetical protein